MDTFTPPKQPVTQSNVNFTAKTLEATFGDGYEQVVSSGLNSVSGIYSLVWDLLTLAERDTIENFFRAKKGAEAFLYTFPGESTLRKFRCKSWSRSHNGALFGIRAELKEVFDIA